MAEVVARSQLAEAGLGSVVAVDSAGTGDWHIGQKMYGRARAQLASRGYDGEAHRARQFDVSWLGERDLVLAMDAANFQTLKSISRTDRADSFRIRLFGEVAGMNGADVPDPYGNDQAEFARVLKLLESAMPRLVWQIAELLETPAPRNV
jgi:protein-tyrosine phosphatase